MAEEWAWLDDRPVFTTHGERGANVTRVPPGAVLPALSGSFVGLVAGFATSLGLAVAAVALAFVSAGDDGAPGGWWWLVLGVPAAVVSAVTFSGVYVTGTELVMRSRPRNLVLLTGLFGGLALASGVVAFWWSWRASDVRLHPGLIEYPGWNDGERWNAGFFTVGACLAAVAGVVCAVFAVRGVRRARGDVERILRLRRTAPQHPGVVAALPDPDGWNFGGDVPIRYRDDDGEHEIRVRVNTTAGKIPVPGTKVIVFAGPDGDVLVETDPEHPLEYHPDNLPYESSSSLGGN